jgi:tight adherence protein B
VTSRVVAAVPDRGVALAAALVVGLATRSPAGAVVAGLVTTATARGVRARRLAAAAARDEQAWVELLGALVLELRGGRAPAAALVASAAALPVPARAGPLMVALRPALRAAGLPGDVAGALSRARPPPLRMLGAAWAVSARTGAPLAGVLDRLVTGARADRAVRHAREAALAAPRASARLLAGLPLLGVLMAAGLGAKPMAFLLHEPAGEACLVVGVLLDLAALTWTARLTAGTW